MARSDGSVEFRNAEAPGASALEDLSLELERLGIVRAPGPRFVLADGERALLHVKAAQGRRKVVSYDPRSGRVKGWPTALGPIGPVSGMLARFSLWATAVARGLLATYAPRLEVGRASFRPRWIEREPISWRKDDRRLHLDAFRSHPVGGRRIIRLFSNIDPDHPRVWELGEDFSAHVARFLPLAKLAPHGVATLLSALGFTKSHRSQYDELMLQFHDRAKRDEAYQSSMRLRTEVFDSGETWIAFTDQVPHAVVSGRHLLEQTFYLPVQALNDEMSSPLRRLESLVGRRLT